MKYPLVKAFTLVELLIVIAIVALLAAIIFPIFSQARRKSYQSTCLSNLKQLGAASFMYAQDYDDHFAFGCDNTDSLPESGWHTSRWADEIDGMKLMPDLLLPYTKTKEVWHCPADNGFTVTGVQLEFDLDGRPNSYKKFGMSYHVLTIIPLLRQTVSGVTAREKSNSTVPEAATKQYGPAQIPFLFDAAGEWHGGKEEEQYRYDVLYCDGHAANTSREDFVSHCFLNFGQ